MIKDITLGQYFPGNSLLHRIEPRMKLLLAVLFITMIFTASTFLSLLVVTVITFLLPFLGKIPMKTVMKSIKPLRWIILIMMILFVLNGSGPCYTGAETCSHVWVDYKLGFLHIVISLEGVIKAICVSIRIVILVVSVSVILSYTTSPIALADAIEQLLSPLKVLHVPVHDFAMMLTIAMRFIPILVEEADKIMSAQAARGADFQSGSLIRRAKALIPVFIPLFVSSIRHADNLATAMECRCYHGGKGRTRMNRLRYAPIDYAAYLVMALLMAGIAVLVLEVGAPYVGILGFRYV